MKLFTLWMVALVGVKLPTYHVQHERVFSEYTGETNRAVLAAVDRIQAMSPEGGGYFTGVKAVPAESPIGFPVSLFGQPLLNPPGTSSYCSGAHLFSEFISRICGKGCDVVGGESVGAGHR